MDRIIHVAQFKWFFIPIKINDLVSNEYETFIQWWLANHGNQLFNEPSEFISELHKIDCHQ